MSYLVMECRIGYAIVLDSEGRFLRVANMGYSVGQKLEDVVLEQPVTEKSLEDVVLEQPVTENSLEEALMEQSVTEKSLEKIMLEQPVTENAAASSGRRTGRYSRKHRWMTRILAAAACLCVLAFGTERLFLFPYGTVRIQINPDVIVSMNRFQYVVGVEGLNDDGKALIEDYHYFGKKALTVSGELTDRAKLLGYLAEGGEITLTVKGADGNWTMETEEVMVSGLQHHCSGSAHVKASEDGGSINEHHDEEKKGEEHHSEEKRGDTHHYIEETEQKLYNTKATESTEEEKNQQGIDQRHSNSFGRHRQEGHETKKSHE